MTAGDLTPNMIGTTRVRINSQETDVEGLVTDIRVHAERTAISSLGEALRHTYDVRLDVTVGRIQITEVSLDHPIQIIG